MMRLLVQTPTDFDDTPWLDGLRAVFPDADVRRWVPGDDASADYALVWKTPPEFFAKPRGLRAVFALGAGVDALLSVVPPAHPLIRLDDAGMAVQMAGYVAREVFRIHESGARTTSSTDAGADWSASREAHRVHTEADFSVGILGLGVLGAHVAASLAGLGMTTHGWSRTPKFLPGVVCHTGPAGLDALLAQSRVLVNLLPLTPETENILNAGFFEKLPRGAHLINVARGAHVVDADLLAALDSGRLSGATLDVFRTEPLPGDHPFWGHPGITVTPHISARTLTGPALAQIVTKIRMLEAGETSSSAAGYVDRSRGY
jgi:glyoxylate/hydroxypyruvate reductase A